MIEDEKPASAGFNVFLFLRVDSGRILGYVESALYFKDRIGMVGGLDSAQFDGPVLQFGLLPVELLYGYMMPPR